MNGRQKLFVKYYTDGETKGNCERSMLKAGYKPKYARHRNNRVLASVGMKEAVEEAQQEVDYKDTQSRENIDREFLSVYQECINSKRWSEAVKCLENLGKHRGYFAEDNAQKTETRPVLTEQERTALEQAGNVLNLAKIRREQAG